MARAAALLAAAAATHLLAVLRLLGIDLSQPPFTAILLPSELRRVSRSLLLVHPTALPQLNATLFSLAALPGAKELRITLWQPLHASEWAAGDATAGLLRSTQHIGLGISHHRPKTCRPQTCRELAAGAAAAMGGLQTAAAVVANGLVDGLDVAFADEVASVVVMEQGVELAPDALQFLDFATSLMHSARALPLSQRVVLGTTACNLRAAHRDWRGRAASLLPGALLRRRGHHYTRTALRDADFVTSAWLISREAHQAMRRDMRDASLPRRGLRAAAAANSSAPRAAHRASHGCADGGPGCQGDRREGNPGVGHAGRHGPRRNYLAPYLERRWRDASFVCPQLPRAHLLAPAAEAAAAGADGAVGLDGGAVPVRPGAAFEVGAELSGDELSGDERTARGAECRQHAAGFVDDGAWRAARQPAACRMRRRGKRQRGRAPG